MTTYRKITDQQFEAPDGTMVFTRPGQSPEEVVAEAEAEAARAEPFDEQSRQERIAAVEAGEEDPQTLEEAIALLKVVRDKVSDGEVTR